MSTPPRLTSRDFDPRVLELFDRYVHGEIDRRGFLAGAGKLAIGASVAAGLLAALTPKFAAAQQVAPDDARITAAHWKYASPAGHGTARAYFVTPRDARLAGPVVLVAHENRGLNPHIEDVARRFALAGYRAVAPDALYPLGGYPGDEDAARELFMTLDQDKVKQDFLAAAKLFGGFGPLGITGFCWGGAMTNWLATQLPGLRAAAPFYGSAPDVAAVPAIRAELLVVLADNDERVNATWPAYEAALQAAGTRYERFQPPGTQHGFHNDTTPRYDAEAAAQAWEKTLALFARHLLAATPVA